MSYYPNDNFLFPSFFCTLNCPMINPRSIVSQLIFLHLRDFRAKIRLFFDICKNICILHDFSSIKTKKSDQISLFDLFSVVQFSLGFVPFREYHSPSAWSFFEFSFYSACLLAHRWRYGVITYAQRRNHVSYPTLYIL